MRERDSAWFQAKCTCDLLFIYKGVYSHLEWWLTEIRSIRKSHFPAEIHTTVPSRTPQQEAHFILSVSPKRFRNWLPTVGNRDEPREKSCFEKGAWKFCAEMHAESLSASPRVDAITRREIKKTMKFGNARAYRRMNCISTVMLRVVDDSSSSFYFHRGIRCAV